MNVSTKNLSGHYAACLALLLTLFVASGFMFSPLPVAAASQGGSLPNIIPRSAAPANNFYQVRLGGNPPLNYEVSAIEGLVARTQPQIFVTHTSSDQFWLNFTAVNYGLKYTTISASQALTKFESYVTDGNGKVKIVLYSANDPLSPTQINMARTLAGVYGALPVSSSELSAVQSLFGGASHINTLYDLRSGYSSKVAAYTWLWSQVGNAVTKSLVSLSPSGDLGLTDYIVENKAFVFDFTNSAAMTTQESNEASAILSNYPKGTQVIGFFALGPETQTIDFLSQRGLFMTPADQVPNLSFMSGLPEATGLTQPAPKPVTYESGKTYLMISFSQGNSLGYMYSGNRFSWTQTDSKGIPIRSEIPESWQVDPLAASLAPPLLKYWYQSMYPTDSFMTGASGGVGYVHPDQLPNLATYLTQADAFSSSVGISTYFFVPGDRGSPQPSLYQAYISGTSATAIYTKQPQGIKPQYVSGAPIFSITYKVPSITTFTVADVTSAAASITSMSKNSQFIWVFMNAANPGLSFISALVSKLGSNFVELRADQFATVYKQSMSGTVSNGLVGYWPMSEGTGTTTADYSTNTNTGSLAGGSAWHNSLACQFGSCLQFDGSSGYVKASGSGLQTGSSSSSLTSWVYLDSYSSTGSAIVSYGTPGTGGALALGVTPSGNLEVETGKGSCSTSASVPLKSWTFVAMTYSAGGTKMNLYIGQNQYACTLSQMPNVTAGSVWIGQLGSGSQYLSGRADDVRIYNRALSQLDVTTLVTTTP